MTASKLEVNAPFDLTLIKSLPVDTEEDVEAKLNLGLQLKNSEPLPIFRRVEILKKTKDILLSKKEELVKQAALEGGKPYADSLVEIERGFQGIDNAIEALNSMSGKEVPMGLTAASVSRFAFTNREPIGLCLAISAFNHPFNLIIHQVIPAVATGCPVIVKPAGTTPLSCISILDALKEAGLDEGWCQLSVCSNELAEKMVTDNRIDFLSFIGSSKVGWYLRSKLAPGTRCALEHGGVAPVIVKKDALQDRLIPKLCKGGFYHAGQVCVSVQRVFADKGISHELAENMAHFVKDWVVGDPLSPDTDIGPLILPGEVNRVDNWVQEAINGGGKLICGGKKLSDTTYAPTVILDPPRNCTLSQNEVFGPVVAIYSSSSDKESIEQANSLDYAFQASVFTQDIDKAFSISKKLAASAVMINDQTAFRVDWMPFAGLRSSGLGVGGIPFTMKDMTYEKMYVLNYSSE